MCGPQLRSAPAYDWASGERGMKLSISLLNERVFNTLWFWPVVLVTLAVVASFATVEIDHAVGEVKGRVIFSGSATSARVVTGTLAGSALSIIGITVPLTLVALQLASSQFSQRILRNFMRDRIVQIFLGAFIGVFAYNLLVLRVIRSSDESVESFVPQISISIGMALSLLSLILFIIFINHIVGLIQVSHILRRIARETRGTIAHLYPESVGLAAKVEDAPIPGSGASVVTTRTSGYLQSVDVGAVFELSRDRIGTVWLVRNIGEFCPEGATIFVLSRDGNDDTKIGDVLLSKLQLGADRSAHEDALFGFRQIVDVAARALSPGVNDPTTAVQCIDHLTDLLHALLKRSFPSVVRRDEDGVVRLVVRAPSFEDFVSEAFDQIRSYGEGDVAVTRRLLQALTELSTGAPAGGHRASLLRQRDLVLSGARRSIKEPTDLASLEIIVI